MKQNDFEEFDPQYWAGLTENNTPASAAGTNGMNPVAASAATQEQQIAEVTRRLVSQRCTIAESYDDWVKLGFALADALGEGGRTCYHQISNLSSKYKPEECDRQYTACLRGHGCGITVKTFYTMAKEAGVDISAVAREALKSAPVCAKSAKVPTGTNNENREKNVFFDSINEIVPSGTLALLAQTPVDAEIMHEDESVDDGVTFSDKLNLEDLPSFLHPVIDSQPDAVGRDKMLLGTLNLISGILPRTFYTIYDRRRVYTPLYNIIYGRFATAKGDLEAVKQIVMPVKNEMRRRYEAEREEYDRQHALWEAQSKRERGPEPQEPPFCTPFISANSSASAVYRALDVNQGWGVMFETEADTLSNMLSKSEYGDYSDLLRKAHHHEAVSMVRVGDKVHIEIDEPRLSVFLTCTGSQLPLLLPASNVANGLASRFLFYALPDAKVEFRDVFQGCDTPVEDTFKELGMRLLSLYHALLARADRPLQFIMTPEQRQAFVSTFRDVLREQFSMLGNGIQGYIYRLALEGYRYAMILTILRRLSERPSGEALFNDDEQALACDERDFNTAFVLVNCLVNHTGRVYAVLGNTDNDPFAQAPQPPTAELKAYYEALPAKGVFKTTEALQVASRLQIPERTAKRLLGDMVTRYQVLGHPRHGVYVKRNVKTPQNV